MDVLITGHNGYLGSVMVPTLRAVGLHFLGASSFGDSAEVRHGVEAAGLTGRVEFRPRVEYNRGLTELKRAALLCCSRHRRTRRTSSRRSCSRPSLGLTRRGGPGASSP